MVLMVRTNDDGPIYLNTAAIESVISSRSDGEDFCTVTMRDVPGYKYRIRGTAAQVAAQINDAERRGSSGLPSVYGGSGGISGAGGAIPSGGVGNALGGFPGGNGGPQ
jgi:hypothetical protein